MPRSASSGLCYETSNIPCTRRGFVETPDFVCTLEDGMSGMRTNGRNLSRTYQIWDENLIANLDGHVRMRLDLGGERDQGSIGLKV